MELNALVASEWLHNTNSLKLAAFNDLNIQYLNIQNIEMSLISF
jgi:hypothetical protein